MLIGEIEQKTKDRFEIVDEFEGYFKAIDLDSEDVFYRMVL